MAVPYTTESDVTADGYTKLTRGDGTLVYEKVTSDSGRLIRHELPSTLSATQIGQAIERVRSEQAAHGRKT